MKKILILCNFAILFAGCSITNAPNSLPVFYSSPIASNDISYLPKPLSIDSNKTQNYLSASFASSALPLEIGTFTMGYLNYNRSHTFKNFNIAYGAFGFYGGTDDDGYNNAIRPLDKNFSGKEFYGGGLRSSIGVFETSGNTEFRILNWENTISFEGGSYASLRKTLRYDNEPLSIGSDKTVLFTTGGSTEIIWRGSKNTNRNYGFRLFVGATTGLKQNINYTDNKLSGLATDFSFFLKIKRAYGVFSQGSNLRQYGGKITLGYSL